MNKRKFKTVQVDDWPLLYSDIAALAYELTYCESNLLDYEWDRKRYIGYTDNEILGLQTFFEMERNNV